jgi:hypothetical protein
MPFDDRSTGRLFGFAPQVQCNYSNEDLRYYTLYVIVRLPQLPLSHSIIFPDLLEILARRCGFSGGYHAERTRGK